MKREYSFSKSCYRVLSFLLCAAMLLAILPGAFLASGLPQVEITKVLYNVNNNGKLRIVWKYISVAGDIYYHIVVKNMDTDTVVFNNDGNLLKQTGGSATLSYDVSASFVPENEYKVWVKGYYKNGQTSGMTTSDVAAEGDDRYYTIPPRDYLRVSADYDDEYDVGCEGTSRIAVLIESSGSWTASKNASWISFIRSTGSSGTNSLIFSVDANSGNARSGVITLTSGSLTAKVYAYQDAYVMSDMEKAEEAYDNLYIGYAAGDSSDSVTKDITLPTTGDYNASISWVSTQPSVVSTSGKVTRQNSDTNVSLTATITVGSASRTKQFSVTVKKKDTLPSLSLSSEELTTGQYRFTATTVNLTCEVRLYINGADPNGYVMSGSNGVYTYTYTFNASGSKSIYAKCGEITSNTVALAVTLLDPLDTPVMADDELSAAPGESVSIRWNAVTDAESYILQVYQNGLQLFDGFTLSYNGGLQAEISFAQAGYYAVTVYAVATGRQQSEGGVTNVDVREQVQIVSGFSMSASEYSVRKGTSLTISWTRPAEPANTQVLYAVVFWNQGSGIYLAQDLTATAFEIPADFTGGMTIGTYGMSVYAYAGSAQNETSFNLIITDEAGEISILGDVNGDGSVTNKDRFILNRYLSPQWEGYELIELAADIDGNGAVDDIDCTILSRHLARWAGYEDLNVFHREASVIPGGPDDPATDSSIWQMSYNSSATSIQVDLKSGQPNTALDHLFIAEDSAGLHHFSRIPAGHTSASFTIKSLQMSRAQYYSFYVLPDGIALVEGNRAQYQIGSGYVPLFGGNMITSVKSGSRTIENNGTAYVDEPLFIRWDGSLGVDSFILLVQIDGNQVFREEYTHSGPGTVRIDSADLSTGTLKITATVPAPAGTGLSDAVTVWTCKVAQSHVVSEAEASYSLYEMRDFLAIAIEQAYYRDSLNGRDNYNGVGGTPIRIIEVFAKGILGTIEYEIEQAVRNADAGIDNGREIINQMVLIEAIKLNISWIKFVKEISSLPSSIIDNFTSKEAKTLYLFTELTDSEYIVLLDGNQNDWARNEKLKELWMLMGDEFMKNPTLTDAYRTSSQKLSSKSISILSKIGKVAKVANTSIKLFNTGANYILEYLYKDEIDYIIDSWISALDDADFQAELRQYKNMYSSQLSVIFNTFADSGLVSKELKEITYLLAKRGLFGNGIKNMIGKIGKSAFLKTINQADTVLLAVQLMYKYLLGCDMDAVYSSLSNLLTIDRLYRQEIEDVICFRHTSFDFGKYIKDLRLAATLARQEYQYYVVILENTLILRNTEDKQYAEQLIEEYKSFIDAIDEWLDPYTAALAAAKDIDACI